MSEADKKSIRNNWQVPSMARAPGPNTSQKVAWYWEQMLMLNPVGEQSHVRHLSVAPNWIHQNPCLKICKTGPCSKAAPTLLHFPSSMQKAGGLSTSAASAEAGKGCICREGSLLSRFVKCETWNRSPHFRPWPLRVRADQSWVQEHNYFRGAFVLHLSHVSLLTKASSFHNNAGANCSAFVARQTPLTIFSLASLPSLQPAGVWGCALKSRATPLKANPQTAQSSQRSNRCRCLFLWAMFLSGYTKEALKFLMQLFNPLREENIPVKELFCQSLPSQKCWQGSDTDAGHWCRLIFFLFENFFFPLLQWKLDF